MNEQITSKMQDQSKQEHVALAFDPMLVVHIFLKRAKMILGITLIFTVVGATYLSFQTPLYTASAMIQLNSHDRPLMPYEKERPSRGDQAAINSEMDILGSPELAERVIDALALNEKEEFNPTAEPTHKINKLGKNIQNFFAHTNHQDITPELERAQVIHAVRERLELKRDPLSYSVRISFTSQSAERAKNIANTFAQEYLNYQVESFENARRDARAWLLGRVDELRADVIKSEGALQNFTADNRLSQINGLTLDDRQLMEMHTALIEARSTASQARSRYMEAKKDISSSSEILNSPVIQNLKAKHSELLRKKSELASQFGPRHPKMASIQNEIDELSSNIVRESKVIAEALEQELKIAEAQVQTLVNDVAIMRSATEKQAEANIELQELTREANANRALYDSFLTRLKETSETITMKHSDASIIARAQIPLFPSKPNKKLIITLFIMLGACVGAVMAMLLEYFARGFSTPQQIEEHLGIHSMGMVPEVRNENSRTLADLAIDHGGSLYTEALKRILASLQFYDQGEQTRSIMMTSSLPQEGKGWLTTALARVMALSGKKVLLIDCDLRRKSISNLLSDEPEFTLNDYLSGDTNIRNIINMDLKSGLHYIGSSPTDGHVQHLLESDKIKALMDYAHEKYDMVFVDAPPVIGLSDTLFLAQLIDKCAFVIQAQQTPRHVVMNAVQILERAHISIAGMILSRVDIEDYKQQEFGNRSFQKKYSDYYQDLGVQAQSIGNIIRFRKKAS